MVAQARVPAKEHPGQRRCNTVPSASPRVCSTMHGVFLPVRASPAGALPADNATRCVGLAPADEVDDSPAPQQPAPRQPPGFPPSAAIVVRPTAVSYAFRQRYAERGPSPSTDAAHRCDPVLLYRALWSLRSRLAEGRFDGHAPAAVASSLAAAGSLPPSFDAHGVLWRLVPVQDDATTGASSGAGRAAARRVAAPLAAATAWEVPSGSAATGEVCSSAEIARYLASGAATRNSPPPL